MNLLRIFLLIVAVWAVFVVGITIDAKEPVPYQSLAATGVISAAIFTGYLWLFFRLIDHPNTVVKIIGMVMTGIIGGVVYLTVRAVYRYLNLEFLS